jgi:transposase
MRAVLESNDNAVCGELYMALELSLKRWKLGFSAGEGIRIRTIDAGDWSALLEEIDLARGKLGCCSDCRVVSCYEAGRDGFWLHRSLLKSGIKNRVVDSSSIEVSRRSRQVKTDRVDVKSLVLLMIRRMKGERGALRFVRVPSLAQEGERRLTRERGRLLKERGSHVARIKGLLFSQGIRVERIGGLRPRLGELRTAVSGEELAEDLRSELSRECARYEQVEAQVRELERLQVERVRAGAGVSAKQIEQLMRLKSVGWQSSWTLVTEFFSWREFTNARQLGACAGLSPTPYASGERAREQGISKAGNRRIRALIVELSWLWLRHQPGSELSRWFRRRFADGGKRMRRIGIVAVARKLLVALWRYLEHGEVPAGAVLKAG